MTKQNNAITAKYLTQWVMRHQVLELLRKCKALLSKLGMQLKRTKNKFVKKKVNYIQGRN